MRSSLVSLAAVLGLFYSLIYSAPLPGTRLSLGLYFGYNPFMKKTFVILAGESAVGKSTLMKALQEKDKRFVPVPLTTDRTPRTLEKEDRNCIGKADFDKKVKNNEFIHVIGKYGNRYGILREQVNKALEEGNIPVSDYIIQEISGLHEFKDILCAFYILPPTLLLLKKRLKDLGRDPDGSRFQIAKNEINFVKSRNFEFPYVRGVLVNDNIEKAVKIIINAVDSREI